MKLLVICIQSGKATARNPARLRSKHPHGMMLFRPGRAGTQAKSETQTPWHRLMRQLIDSFTLRMGRAPGSHVPKIACVSFLPDLKRLIPCGSITHLNSEKMRSLRNATIPKPGRACRETRAKLAPSKTPFAAPREREIGTQSARRSTKSHASQKLERGEKKVEHY